MSADEGIPIGIARLVPAVLALNREDSDRLWEALCGLMGTFSAEDRAALVEWARVQLEVLMDLDRMQRDALAAMERDLLA